jgi:regulator of RNase E activity RraA
LVLAARHAANNPTARVKRRRIVSNEELDNIRERYLRLYTGAIADMVDKSGHRNQVLPCYITPFTTANRVAGLAFTVQGYPCADTESNDMATRLAILDSMTPGTISVWACGGSMDCAHWGEIMSTAVRQRGCTGAVVEGGLRDVDYVNAMNYPVFARYKSPATSLGRWEIKAHQVPIKIGNTVIHPGDFVFGDVDGVVIVPAALTLEVLKAAEEIYEREAKMRAELRQGLSVQSAFEKYGAL